MFAIADGGRIINFSAEQERICAMCTGINFHIVLLCFYYFFGSDCFELFFFRSFRANSYFSLLSFPHCLFFSSLSFLFPFLFSFSSFFFVFCPFSSPLSSFVLHFFLLLSSCSTPFFFSFHSNFLFISLFLFSSFCF